MGCFRVKQLKAKLDADLTQTYEQQGLTAVERAERDAVRGPLILRSYHLPGYNIFQDWWQFLANNHPIFGIWCHHRFHPVGRTVRVFSLLGSVLFGLALTNIIYLAFVLSGTDSDTEYIRVNNTLYAPTTGVDNIDSNVSALSVTNYNLALWTVGSFVHGLYDNTIWGLAACTCCLGSDGESTRQMTDRRMKRYQSTGTFLVLLSVVVVTALATLAAVLVAALNSDNSVFLQETDSNGLVSDVQVLASQSTTARDFQFVYAYFVELLLDFFVYYPVVGTILFSGVITCGRYPVTGGRPFELRQEALGSSEEKEEGTEVVLGENGEPQFDDLPNAV